jgi:hypothetical protein
VGPASGEAPRNETSPTLNYRRAFSFSYAASAGARRSELFWTRVSFVQQEIFVPLGLQKGAYLCRKKRFLAVWCTKCPQI